MFCVTMEIIICKQSEAFIGEREPLRNLELENEEWPFTSTRVCFGLYLSDISFNFSSQTALSALIPQPGDGYSLAGFTSRRSKIMSNTFVVQAAEASLFVSPK